MQTRTESLTESLLNVGSGFIISVGVSMYAYPFFGFDVKIGQAVILTLLFTVVSVVRGYCWRRAGNWYARRGFLKTHMKGVGQMPLKDQLDYWQRAYGSMVSNIADMPKLIKNLMDENRELKKRLENDN